MPLRSTLGGFRQHLLCSLYSRSVTLANKTPLVSFCFDDFPRSSYATGGPILRCFGAHGTYYAAMGLMNTSNDLGDQFRPEDLDSLLADGHELACHTFNHLSCRTVGFGTFESDVRKGCHAIRVVTRQEAVNFAYPYGHVTLAAKKGIGARMSSCRGIYGGLNWPTADLNLLRANSLYGDVDRFPGAARLLDAAEQHHGWLIFYTHDVRPNPSPFGCTPELLERTVSAASESGFCMVTVRDAIHAIASRSKV